MNSVQEQAREQKAWELLRAGWSPKATAEYLNVSECQVRRYAEGHVRIAAERLADEAVERYERAIQFLWEKIDKKTGRMKARWLGGQVFTLPQLIENERRERRQLGQLFHWPTDTS